jgi:hypothetical protein
MYKNKGMVWAWWLVPVISATQGSGGSQFKDCQGKNVSQTPSQKISQV